MAVLRKGTIFSLTFLRPHTMEYLEKSCALWLSAYHYGLQWEDRMIPYNMTKYLIIMAIIDEEKNDDNKALVYVKGLQKTCMVG